MSEWHTITAEIPFATERHATIAKQAIEVDPDLQPQSVKRMLEVNGKVLKVTYSTLTVRLARLCLNAFLENVDLVTRTLEVYGDLESDET